MLTHYNNARKSLAAACRVDEVLKIRNDAEAMRAYARQVKEKQIEADALAIKMRATRRLGEMMAAQRDAGQMAKGARAPATKRGTTRDADQPASLAELGIDKNLAQQARDYAAVPESDFNETVEQMRQDAAEIQAAAAAKLIRKGEVQRAAKKKPKQQAAIGNTDVRSVKILVGDCLVRLPELPSSSVHCIITSPPYWALRDYGVEGQLGHEPTPDEYIAGLAARLREARRVLRDDGTAWVIIADTYASDSIAKEWGEPDRENRQERNTKGWEKRVPPGIQRKSLCLIPARLQLALQADGWIVRQIIIWHKPNVMPGPWKDRCTVDHEYVLLLTKSERYHFDADAIAEPSLTNGTAARVARAKWGQKGNPTNERNGTRPRDRRAGKGRIVYSSKDVAAGNEMRNKRTVWTITHEPFGDAHFAVFPTKLVEPMILAGCPEGGTVLDPFGGAGTTGLVADRLKRNAILIELNPEYAQMAAERIRNDAGMLAPKISIDEAAVQAKMFERS